jgi:hypothetical protein
MGACRDLGAKPRSCTTCRIRKPAVRSALITVCGLMALFTPLALWVAWSPWMFWLIIACGCAALITIYLLLAYSRDEFF